MTHFLIALMLSIPLGACTPTIESDVQKDDKKSERSIKDLGESPEKDSGEGSGSETNVSPTPSPSPEPAGLATDPVLLLAPTNLIDGDSAFSRTTSQEIEWSAVVDAAGYEVAIGSTAGATDILDWKAVGNVTVYRASELNLSSSHTYFASVRAVAADGIKGLSANADGWSILACPAGYIPIAGNTTAGLGGSVYTKGTKSNYNWTTMTETIRLTDDFCVMKYEAKSGASYTAISVAANLPWVSIKREAVGANNDAQEACENNGPNYQLIGNQHWQAIARSIESVVSNFDRTGNAADYTLNHGHADNGPNTALAADDSDSKGCIGVTSNGDPDDDCGGSWHINKRTHLLANGEVIWDIAGNVYEWVRDPQPLSSQGSADYVNAASYNDALKFGPLSDYSGQTGTQRGGLGYFFASTNNGTMHRGGYYNHGTNAGIYHAGLGLVPTQTVSRLGFRCVYAP